MSMDTKKERRELEVMFADPAGNGTIFVLTPCQRQDYQKIASYLLDDGRWKGEQVAFMMPQREGQMPRIEMSGLEFCGNAARAFGLYCARARGLAKDTPIEVSVSGTDKVLTVWADIDLGYSRVQMPDMVSCRKVTLAELLSRQITDGERNTGYIVDLGGIVHVVVDAAASEELFWRIADYVIKQYDPPAVGVMFRDRNEEKAIPLVYVRDVDTLYWEGSCGSGAYACAAALAMERIDGGSRDFIESGAIRQPAGVIDVRVSVRNGIIGTIEIGGAVKLWPPERISVEI